MGIRFSGSEEFAEDFGEFEMGDTDPGGSTELDDIEQELKLALGGSARKWRSVEEYREWKNLDKLLNDYEFGNDL